MSSKEKIPATPAVRVLRQAKVPFTCHLYKYIEHGGTKVAAEQLELEEHAVIKTIVMEDDSNNPLIVLMHGDCEISTKKLAREINVKSISPASPEKALRTTGYRVGGTSPLGTLRKMAVYIERSILSLRTIYINGGKRGFLVGVSPSDIQAILNPVVVEIIS